MSTLHKTRGNGQEHEGTTKAEVFVVYPSGKSQYPNGCGLARVYFGTSKR